jgi:hypothetical protein
MFMYKNIIISSNIIMSVRRSNSSGSRHSKGIPTPPPLPMMRSARTLKMSSFKKNAQSSFHSGATIAYDGIGRVVWLKDVEKKKIYFNHNNPLTLTDAEIKAIQKKNEDLGVKYGGKRKSKHKRTRKHTRKHY